MTPEKVVIITPCFNENKTVIAFLKSVEKVVANLNEQFEIVVVDDCSSDDTLQMLQEFRFDLPTIALTVLPLKFNVGHQSAIFQGLLYAKNLDSNKFIIMDSDGEDDPNAIRELVGIHDYGIVNVVRGRRKESLTFQISYHIYRMIFKVITGKALNFGNYCMINKRVLESTCHTSYIHFAAHLSKQRVKSTQIVYDRLKRIDGSSKMNMTSLVHHGFKSFIEYADDLLMVFLKIFLIIILGFLGVASVVLYKKFFTNEAILGWASTMMLGLFNIGIACLGFFVLGILMLNMISRRNQNKAEIFVK